ncbi:MAG: hypothetical protein KDD60_09655, partial [Bdellovibrionales bacterium]|nr:hypothetical protein [Bdellovibrionales bacterium]
MTDSKMLDKHLKWIEADCGLKKSAVKNSLIACYVGNNKSGVTNENNTILLCLTDEQLGVYRTRWFSQPRMAIDIRSITKIECHSSQLRLKLESAKLPELTVQFKSQADYERFTILLNDTRDTVSGLKQYQELLDQLDGSSSKKLELLKKVEASPRKHPSIGFLRLVLAMEKGNRKEVIDLLIKHAEKWKDEAQSQAIAFADLIANVKMTQAETIEFFETHRISLGAKDTWKLAVAAVLLLRQGDWLQGVKCANSTRQQLQSNQSPSGIQVSETWSDLIYRLAVSFKDEVRSYHTDLQWAKPSVDAQGIAWKDKLGERLTVDRMEKHWVRILFEYSLCTLPINKCNAAWSQLRSGNEAECRETLQMSPQAYWESIESVTPHRDPRYLRAALLVAELHLRDGENELARWVMDEAYRNTLVLSNKSNDLLFQNVFILSKLYIGIAEANFEKASIYARQLPNEIDWAKQLCQILVPE